MCKIFLVEIRLCNHKLYKIVILYTLLVVPLIGIFLISSVRSYYSVISKEQSLTENNLWSEINFNLPIYFKNEQKKNNFYKKIAFITSILNLIISLIIYILFDFSNNQFQFIQEHYDLSFYDIYLGVDGISIYFVLLTTIIMPIALISNWNSITNNIKSYLIIMLLLETLLLGVFLVLDILLFYIFFESILPPLFILIGLFGSSNKVRASFYIFLYTFNLKCKRAKHRGSPKVLVTKVIREILLLAWLMTQGMVTSLVFISEKLLLVADMWVTAVLNHPYFRAKACL